MKYICISKIEIPYFSTGIYPDICCRCGGKDDLVQEESYLPYCRACEVDMITNRKNEQKRKRGKRNFFNEKLNAKKQRNQNWILCSL